MVGAREAIAESIAAEMGADLDEAFMVAIDKILIRLWLFGFRVSEVPDDDPV